MSCSAKLKKWGLFPRGHDWEPVTNPLAVERGGLSLSHDIMVGAQCTACYWTDLQPLPPPYSIQHTVQPWTWKDGRGDYALEVSPEKAAEILAEAVEARPSRGGEPND